MASAISLHDTSPTAHSDLRAEIDLTIQSAIANFYTKDETDDLVSDAIYAHDTGADAHGDVRAGVAGLDSRVSALEVIVGGGISTNPFNVTFLSLSGVTVTGVWNKTQGRIEF